MSCELSKRIESLANTHGSLRNLAEILNIDVGYLSRLKNGKAKNPSKSVLKKLGLKQVVTYELTYVREAIN